jgi:hypothetical protein
LARYSWQRVRREPPYISRSKVDQALFEVVNCADKVLLVLGEKAGSGVTRSSKNFLYDNRETRFLRRRDRLPVLLDLCGGIACLHACELLALLRNGLVRRVNGLQGISNLGSHLAAFDAYYVIWAGKTGRAKTAPALTPTARAKAAKGLAKLAVNFGTMGTVEFLGTAAELTDIIEDLGWAAEGAIDMTRERATEGVFERTVKSADNFVKRFIRPRLDQRLRKALGDRDTDPEVGPSILHDLLIEAIQRVQAGLGDVGLMLLIDAIDMTDDDDPDTVDVRFSLGGITSNSTSQFVPSVLSGRGPAKRWRRAVPLHQRELLGPIPEEDIRSRFSSAGISLAELSALLVEAGSPKPIHARALSDAYLRRGLSKTG